MFLPRRVSGAVAAVLMASGALLLTSGAAHAEPWPTGCDWGFSGLNSTVAKCTGGAGSYRAVAKCSSNSYAYGSWEPAGSYPGQSTARCGGRPISASIGLRQY